MLLLQKKCLRVDFIIVNLCFFIFFSKIDANPLLKPYFQSKEIQNAVEKLRDGDCKSAIEIFEKIRSKIKGENKKRIEFLLAISKYHCGDCKDSLKILRTLKKNYKLMENHINFIEAKCAFLNNDIESAKQILKKISENSSFFIDSKALLIEILLKQNNYITAGKIYEENKALLSRFRNELEKKIFFPFLKNSKNIEEAKKWIFKYPSLIKNEEIKKTIENLNLHIDIDIKFQIGLIYYGLHRNNEAKEIFSEIMKDAKKGEKKWCDAGYYLAKTFDKMRNYNESISFYDQIIENCKSPWEFRADALFSGGKAAFQLNEEEKVKKLFEMMEIEFPKISYNDDAYIYLAHLYKEKNQRKLFKKTLQTQIKKYPEGDMLEEAHWLLVWDAYKRKEWKRALKLIKNAIAEIKKERFYYSRGRMFYWKGRIYEKIRAKKLAISSYKECLKKYPLSYYSVLSLSRLRKFGFSLKKIIDDAISHSEVKAPLVPPYEINDKSILENESFKSAVEFYKLGLKGYFQKEVNFFENIFPDNPSAHWIVAYFHHILGNYSISHNIPRRKRNEFQDYYPVSNGMDYWLIAYPFAYKEIIEKVSKSQKMNDFLIISIIREESGFYPNAESYANALGLMQLLYKTALRMAKGEKFKVEEKTLFEPEKNIVLGVKYLNFLKKLFHNPLYFIAAYNAGEGAVRRWKKEKGGGAPDEFVESIPARQARNYTKRVIESYAAYTFLYSKGEEKYLFIDF